MLVAGLARITGHSAFGNSNMTTSEHEVPVAADYVGVLRQPQCSADFWQHIKLVAVRSGELARTKIDLRLA